MEPNNSSFVPQLASKEAELALMLEQAHAQAASIKEEAERQAKEILGQAASHAEVEVEQEDSSPEENESVSNERDKKRAELLAQVKVEGSRLRKRAQKRQKELSHFIYSRLFLKER